MAGYEVYATRLDDPHVVDLIPARGLSFSLPVNDHGECTFEAAVEPGRSFWRSAIAAPVSGVLVTRDGVPVWDGWLTDERMAGPRSFSFTAREWGHYFEEKVPAIPKTYTQWNDHAIFRDLVSLAQLVPGQNVQVQVDPSTAGGGFSTRVINAWDDTTVGREFRSIGEAAGGPEWYFGSAGTLENPVRQLVLGDRLGHTSAETVLEYVEDTEAYDLPGGPPMVSLLSSLFPGPAPVVPVRRSGGNLIAQGRSKSTAEAATVAVATGSGEEAARLLRTATASNLLAAGWPRMTTTNAYSDVTVAATLQAHANADLARRAGIATGYSLVSLDGDPTADWTQTPRGSTVRVVLDTDIYGSSRPVGGPDGFDARCTNITVRVPDSGAAQIEWSTVDVLEIQ